jgi:hypothetical protein
MFEVLVRKGERRTREWNAGGGGGGVFGLSIAMIFPETSVLSEFFRFVSYLQRLFRPNKKSVLPAIICQMGGVQCGDLTRPPEIESLVPRAPNQRSLVVHFD